MDTQFNASLYTISFTTPGPKAPPALLAEGILTFHGGMLEGYQLRGFSVWGNGPDKPVSVTLPSRSYMAGGVKKNWDLLRPTTNDAEVAKEQLTQLQSIIRVSYLQWQATQMPKAAAGIAPPIMAGAAAGKTTTQQAFSQAAVGVAEAKAQLTPTLPITQVEDL